MKILVVDDIEANRYLLFALLSSQGYEVIEAEDGNKALEVARKDLPDMIVSDVLMPQMDGFSLCHIWKSDPILKVIPFVFYTATYTQAEDREFALALGADSFLVKPMENQEFLDSISNVISMQKGKSSSEKSTTIRETKNYYEEYSGRLLVKLEDKVRQLEAVNKKLTAKEEQNRLLLESTGDAIFGVDAKGICTFANPACTKLLKYTSVDELLGKKMHQLVQHSRLDGSPYPEEESLIYKSIKNNLGYHDDMQIMWCKDANHIPIEFRSYPTRLNNNIVGAVVTFVDITERLRVERELRCSQKMKAIGELTGGIAHDFNNQLGVIIGYLDFLRNRYGEEEKVGDWINMAVKSTEHCIDLTRSLLTFSRKQQIEKKAVELNTQLLGMRKIVERSVTPEIQVHYDLRPNLWITKLDPGEFEDALLNIVINARDAMPNGGELFLSSHNVRLDAKFVRTDVDMKPGEYVQICIKDTGSGINQEVLEHVFEPFYTTKDLSKGTGLGLAMVYGFAKRSKGHVRIDSDQQQGTTVYLYFPKSEEINKPTELIDQSVDRLPHGDETLLVVDDEPQLLNIAVEFLNDLGYNTIKAQNGAQALKLLENNKIDLLFSDVVMPGGVSGYELAKTACNLEPELKVLLTSGYVPDLPSETDERTVQLLGKLLNKPYRKKELAARVRSVLDS